MQICLRHLPLLVCLLQLFFPTLFLAALCFGWIYRPLHPQILCFLHAALSVLILILLLGKKPQLSKSDRACSAWSVSAAALNAFIWLMQEDALLILPAMLTCGAALWLCIRTKPGTSAIVSNSIIAGVIAMILLPTLLLYSLGAFPEHRVVLETPPSPGGSLTAQVVRDSNYDTYLEVRYEPANGLFGALERTLESYTEGDILYIPQLEWLDSDTLLADETEYDL